MHAHFRLCIWLFRSLRVVPRNERSLDADHRQHLYVMNSRVRRWVKLRMKITQLLKTVVLLMSRILRRTGRGIASQLPRPQTRTVCFPLRKNPDSVWFTATVLVTVFWRWFLFGIEKSYRLLFWSFVKRIQCQFNLPEAWCRVPLEGHFSPIVNPLDSGLKNGNVLGTSWASLTCNFYNANRSRFTQTNNILCWRLHYTLYSLYVHRL